MNMNYIAAAISDVGNRKTVNQDALMIKSRMTVLGNLCFCVICDGMGGLTEGEVASAHVIRRLSEWFLLQAGNMKRFDKILFYLERELHRISKEILEYGRNSGFAVGTTATIFITTGKQFGILHVGDTRVYRITKRYGLHAVQLTSDHSVNDYMLTQSVGAVDVIMPEIIRGRVQKNDLFLLCTDGFRHKNSLTDLKRGLNPEEIKNVGDLEKKLRIYVDRARGLGENDDISVLAVKTGLEEHT